MIMREEERMPKGLQRKGIARRNKMLHAAIKLFLENGYEKTPTATIAAAAGMSPSSFFAAFKSKEALLLTLVKVMFDNQFSSAEQLQSVTQDPVLLYAIETALQIYIAEISDPLRELYVAAYSLPSTSEYIYTSTARKLQHIFSSCLPEAQPMDFYEMDVASSGIMRAFMARKCDIYFTMDRKLARYLQCTLTLYAVPPEKQQQIIAFILQMDLKPVAEGIIGGMLEKAEAGIDIISEEP